MASVMASIKKSNAQLQEKFKLNPQLTKRLNKLDETRLNKILQKPDSKIIELLRDPLPRLCKERQIVRPIKTATTKDNELPIKPGLKQIIQDLRLLDEPNYDRRMFIFIGYCLYRNYTWNTSNQYYKILRRHGIMGVGDQLSKIRIDPVAFVDRGKPHTRIVSMDSFKLFVEYLLKHFSHYTAPLLIAVYTGLRTTEILKFSTYTLYQLKSRLPIISIKRKQTVVRFSFKNKNSLNGEQEQQQQTDPLYWQPVYSTHFTLFIDKLIDLYKPDLDELTAHQHNSILFHCTPKTLGNRVRHMYYNACHTLPPNGFGIHSCRNLIAQLMSQNTDNIIAIQQFLQHRNIETTRRYIKADFSNTTKTFNRLTNYQFADIKANLK